MIARHRVAGGDSGQTLPQIRQPFPIKVVIAVGEIAGKDDYIGPLESDHTGQTRGRYAAPGQMHIGHHRDFKAAKSSGKPGMATGKGSTSTALFS